MDLPPSFLETHRAIAGDEGRTWVESLPVIIATCEQRWDVVVGAPFRLSLNYAAPATRADGAEFVFKAIAPHLDADLEPDVLRLYAGRGAVELVAHAVDHSAMLLERCLPGAELASLFPDQDDAASAAAAGVMTQLWSALPDGHPYPGLAQFTDVLDRLDEVFGGPAWPMDRRVADAAIGLRRDLLASAPETVLLHGDLHHHNILSAQRQPWLCIDPKGVAGERAYEPSPLFYNPDGEWPASVDIARALSRRVDVISERAGLDRQRVIGWAVVQGVVSSAWRHEDAGAGWPRCERVAELALNLL
jgi:streptomycin 6-kinase